MNRLICTFTSKSELEETINKITNNYTIPNNKIIILKGNNEYICSYSVDYFNLNNILENSVVVHRKKEHNILYSLNALNKLIIELNTLKIKNNTIPWHNYKNSLILIKNNNLNIINTYLYKYIKL